MLSLTETSQDGKENKAEFVATSNDLALAIIVAGIVQRMRPARQFAWNRRRHVGLPQRQCFQEAARSGDGPKILYSRKVYSFEDAVGKYPLSNVYHVIEPLSTKL